MGEGDGHVKHPDPVAPPPGVWVSQTASNHTQANQMLALPCEGPSPRLLQVH